MLFLKDLRDDEVDSLRLIVKELIEVNEHITYILVCPSSEKICTMNLIEPEDPSTPPTTTKFNLDDSQYLKQQQQQPVDSSAAIYLPVQMFEVLHLQAYHAELLRAYVRISLKLEIENLAATQYSREAFSDEEMQVAKRIQALVAAYQRQHEDEWRDSRWIVTWINYAREKPVAAIAHQHCSLYFVRAAELRRFLTQLTSKSTRFTFKCERCQAVLNSVSLACTDTENLKKNVYNQVTRLPDDTNASRCKCSSPDIASSSFTATNS